MHTRLPKVLRTCEMHCGGEPLRIMEGPDVPGDTLLEKRRNLKTNFDHYRKLLMLEPRGHTDMYGCFLFPPIDPGADYSVVFTHNEGYSTMCGHATICLGRYVAEKLWMVDRKDGETRVVLECPCGLVELFVKHSANREEDGCVRFISTPAFPYLTECTAQIPDVGTISFDISYGGVYYAIIQCNQCGIEFGKTAVSDIIRIAMIIKRHLMQAIFIRHPSTQDLAFLYGVIFVDDTNLVSSKETTNMTIFADGEADRSPCGSGATARLALMYKKGQVRLNEEVKFISAATGSVFRGKVICTSEDAVKVEVSGKAYFTGTCEFIVEDDDPFKEGFLIK